MGEKEREKFLLQHSLLGEHDDYDSENSGILEGLPSSSSKRRRGKGRGEGGKQLTFYSESLTFITLKDLSPMLPKSIMGAGFRPRMHPFVSFVPLAAN